MSGFFSEPTDRYPPRINEIEQKKKLGNFWGKDGAIADTKELAYLALCRLNVSNALWLMIDVHTNAQAHAQNCVRSFEIVFVKHRSVRLWRERYKSSNRMIRIYMTMWKILSFFSRVPA